MLFRSPEEDAIIAEWYPKEGLPGALVKLQEAGYIRTSSAVVQRARILRMKSPHCAANNPVRPDERKPPKRRWNPKLDALYQEAKALVDKGVSVTCASEAVGMTRDQFNRRRRIETIGRDRR